MKAIVRVFAAAVHRAPTMVVIASLVLAAVFGYFAPEMEVATGNEGFAPDNAEIQALETVNELFGTEQQSVFQVLVRDPGGDVVSAEGVRTALAVEDVIRRVGGDSLRATPEQPGVLSFAAPVVGAAQQQGIPLDQVDDATVDTIYEAAIAEMPPEQAGFITGLLAEGSAGTEASSGLVLAFFEMEEGSVEAFDAQAQLEENLSAFMESILRAKPAAAKGRYVRGVTVSSTMGPGVPLDTNIFARS